MADAIVVVGVLGDDVSAEQSSAREALARAEVVVGGTRHLAGARPLVDARHTRCVELHGDVDAIIGEIDRATGLACVLASGDPGFFGIVRPLAERFGQDALTVLPAPSSVSIAFARLGINWDDAVVVSAHGRPLPDAAAIAAGHAKAAVLVSPANPPEALGRALIDLGATHPTVAVCSRLGSADEAVQTMDLPALAAGTWDPLSVVVLFGPGADGDDGGGAAAKKTLAWGIDAATFAHRASMITKGEVRAVVLGKLALPFAGERRPVLWDLGAGSGSVAIECARLAPWLDVYAVERDHHDATRARGNAARLAPGVKIVEADAKDVVADLPEPDRVFVGGGGAALLDTVLTRLRPGGVVVATYAALDRAAEAARRLGALVQLGVARGAALPDGSWRLDAENPVFVAWGPQ